MGTRFMATKEAPIHENVKRRLVEASEFDTIHLYRPLKNTSRYFRNSVAEEAHRIEKEKGAALTIADIAPLVNGQRGRSVYLDGDMEGGVWTAGLAASLIHDIPSCAELIDRMVADARQIIRRRTEQMLEEAA